jgi:hypothetical protein
MPARSDVAVGGSGASPAANGMVVAPLTGSTTDAALEQSIIDSFSDAVTVTPGQNGTAGVITPQFRTSAGPGYLYVMVPVATTSSSSAAQQ